MRKSKKKFKDTKVGGFLLGLVKSEAAKQVPIVGSVLKALNVRNASGKIVLGRVAGLTVLAVALVLSLLVAFGVIPAEAVSQFIEVFTEIMQEVEIQNVQPINN